jgi:anti-anti-sigma regulatory factor
VSLLARSPLASSLAFPEPLNFQHIPAIRFIRRALAENVPCETSYMLRISVTDMHENITLDLEGRLAGPWTSELERCWRDQQAQSGGKPLIVRLRAVTFIDDAGKELLARMFEQDTKLEGAGCSVRAILAEITAAHVHQRRSQSASGSKT